MAKIGSLRQRGARRLLAVLAMAVTVLVVSACGSSNSNRSTADPAGMVPASTAMYFSINVPTSDQLGQFKSIVTDFAGPNAWTKLSNDFNSSLAKNNISWSKDIAPWIGSQVGFAITNFSSLVQADQEGSSAAKGIVVIFPTNNIKAAVKFAKSSKAFTEGATYAQDGNYLLLGDPSAIAQIKQGGAMLSSAPGFSAEEKAESGANANFYVNIHDIASQFEGLAGSQGGSISGTLEKQIGQIPADSSLGIGFTANAKTISMDIVPHDIPKSATGGLLGGGSSSAPDTVAGLPGDSFLALAANLTVNTSSTAYKDLISTFTDGLSSGLGGSSVDQLGGTGIQALTSVLPALGPLQLSVSGQNLLAIKAGLTMTSSNPTAAAKLLSTIYNGIQSGGSVPVSGTAKDFSINAGPFNVKVTDQAGSIVALLGYSSAAQLLSPSTTLASNGAYKSAISTLPSGAKVPVYVNFASIKTLLSAFSSGQVAKVKQVLGKLSYLVVGTSPGDIRVVLGLN